MRIRALYDNWVSPQRWMDRLRVGVALRVAAGLVLLLSCVLLIARAVRLFPRDDQLQLSRRSAIAEMAALQAAVGISQHDEVLVGRVLEETVRRCDDVESAALCHDGTIVVQTAGHQKYWNAVPSDSSTATHVRVVLFDKTKPWGELQLVFAPRAAVHGTWLAEWSQPAVRLTIFVVAASLLFFWFYLYRMLTTLDPAAAIPARTQLLMDTLVEGMAILDEGGRIVMTNQSFAETAFSSIERLMGQKLSSLRWVTQGDGGADGNTICPWDTVASRELRQRDVRMQLLIGARHARRLNVNTSPIRGTDDRFLGMAVTFADETVTAAENLNMTDFVARVSAASANVGRLCEELQAHADVAHREELGAMNSAVSEVVELCHSALQPSKVSSVAPAAPATAGSNS